MEHVAGADWTRQMAGREDTAQCSPCAASTGTPARVLVAGSLLATPSSPIDLAGTDRESLTDASVWLLPVAGHGRWRLATFHLPRRR